MPAALDADTRERLRAGVRARIRDVPDFPKPGILFRDITPVLADAETLAGALDLHIDRIADLVGHVDTVVGIESRGFLFGMAVAARIGAGFVVVRKPGKLPAKVVEATYELEYGTDRLQIHADAIRPGERVIIVDDLLATGGTASRRCASSSSGSSADASGSAPCGSRPCSATTEGTGCPFRFTSATGSARRRRAGPATRVRRARDRGRR